VPKVVRIPITNVHMDGDYTGRIFVGPKKQSMEVLFDTGSSMLVLDSHKYRPDVAGGDQTTKLAQSEVFEDKTSWTGAVVRTAVSIGDGASAVTAAGINAAVAYEQSADVFGAADGVLGLAYAALDDAFEMPADTWSERYTPAKVKEGRTTTIPPYLTQLAKEGIVSDTISFFTRRSLVHQGGGGAKDPLNQGWMIVGGGEESKDLYTGTFQTAKILADDWYSTKLKAVIVGDTPAIPVRARGKKGTSSNSIVDSGTNSLDLGRQLRKLMLSKFSSSQQALLSASISEDSDNRPVAMTKLDLTTWPDIIFILQGVDADVRLRVSPTDYWQVNAPKVGAATAAITAGEDGSAILGLPLMNGYFTIFDGEADGGRGVIRFATSKR
jgi:hypothetical protein